MINKEFEKRKELQEKIFKTVSVKKQDISMNYDP